MAEADNQNDTLRLRLQRIGVEHCISGFVFLTECNLINVNYQSLPVSPFETHKGIILVSLAALLLFATASVVEVKLCIDGLMDHQYATFAGNIRLLFSSLGIIALLMIMDPITGWIVLVMFVCFFGKVACDSRRDLCQFVKDSALCGLGMANKLIGNLNCFITSEQPSESHNDPEDTTKTHDVEMV
ncbi:hypothetical protein Tsubulata_012011 [Turnera subulata]|uniref:Transmembrane protein n=1 Tax=Turnera subulata TaxID=218843 RepID=A0A9Q0FDE9_9ROSI|nr:hypothetical protein Tsubulata_012011 [Turnera subulata]